MKLSYEIRRWIIRIMVVCGVALGMSITASVVVPPEAHASSTHCTTYGTGIKGPVRNGQFCDTLIGSGVTINRVTSNFGSTIPGLDRVCNPSLRLEVYDRNSNLIAVRYGAQATGCSWGSWYSAPELHVNWPFPAADQGYAKVSLLDSGARVVATNEHRISA